MRITRAEREQPREWLERLGREHESLFYLVAQSGGLAQAAYRVASAARRVENARRPEPSVRELKAAARMIAARTGVDESLPIWSAVVSQCEPAHEARMPLPPSRRKAS